MVDYSLSKLDESAHAILFTSQKCYTKKRWCTCTTCIYFAFSYCKV